MSQSIKRLVDAAKEAAKNAYAPYSAFHVGAAIQLDNGHIVTGCNMENASYGVSICAEAVAITKANSEGHLGKITAIAIAGGHAKIDMSPDIASDPVTPCGTCRQMLKEVADVNECDLPIYCAHAKGYVTYSLSELLPHAFGPAHFD